MPWLNYRESSCSLYRNKTHLYLGSFQTKEAHCGKGFATKLLAMVAEIADLLNLPVVLNVGKFAHCAKSQEELIKFYKKNGYKLRSGGHRYEKHGWMRKGGKIYTSAEMYRPARYVALLPKPEKV